MKQLLTTMIFLIFASGISAQSSAQLSGLQPELANKLAMTAVECLKEVKPQKGLAVNESPDCSLWLSSMHSHWALVKLLREFPGLPAEKEIRSLIGENLNPMTVEIMTTELMQNTQLFAQSESWAWVLKLQTVVDEWDDADAVSWSAALKPFTELLVNQFLQHTMTMAGFQPAEASPRKAFALSLAWDYAVATDNTLLKEMIQNKSLDLYLSAEQCEFSTENSYFAPCLTEAALMARAAPGDLLKPWMERYLPAISIDPAVATQHFSLSPPDVSAQEVAQSLSAAWSMAGITKKSGNEQAFEAESRKLIEQTIEFVAGSKLHDSVVATFLVYAIEISN
ncbi:MAG: DUF2891 family protein [Bacteroidales bacterium]